MKKTIFSVLLCAAIFLSVGSVAAASDDLYSDEFSIDGFIGLRTAEESTGASDDPEELPEIPDNTRESTEVPDDSEPTETPILEFGRDPWHDKPEIPYKYQPESIHLIVREYEGYTLAYSLNGSYAAVYSIKNVTESGLNISVPEYIVVDGVQYPVTTISAGAFYNCRNLTSVSGPSVTTIGSDAFRGCSNLTSVFCPNVSTVGSYAFKSCYRLISVPCPNVTTIGDSAFYNCSGLTSVSCPNVTTIGDSAFYNCSGLTSVSCPNVTDIGKYAFCNCRNLTSVSGPSVMTIGPHAFISCRNLTSVSCPNVTNIGSDAFRGCYNLTSVSCPNVTIIGDHAFDNCRELTSVSCPNVTSIGPDAFIKCIKLTGISISGSNPYYSVDSFALFEKNPSGMTLHTFLGKNKTSYTVPGNVTDIGPYAFFSCRNLTSVSCPNVTNIGSDAFRGCSNLTSVFCPNVTSIGDYAFDECSNLTSVSCPNIMTVGDSAFSQCYNLTVVDCQNIPTIGDSAFYNCSGLTSVISYGNYSLTYLLLGNNAVVYRISNVTRSGLNVQIPANITVNGMKYNVTIIGDSAFRNCSGLISVSCPRVVSIGNSAFRNCSGLTSVSCPEVVSIGNSAFRNCSGLTSVSIPNATDIGDSAFCYCSDLTSVSFPNTTNIGESAFCYCSDLTSVSFPNTTNIGESAFCYCSDLTSVSFPNATNIGNSAFYSCSGLTSVSFPNVTIIGSYAFGRCYNLTAVDFPKVTTIGSSAFRDCGNLTSRSPCISYGNYSLTYLLIGNNAVVHHISNVTQSGLNIQIPANITVNGMKYDVTVIGDSAFRNSDIVSVSCPNVTFIDYMAFANCSDLTSVSFPNVTDIGDSAFCYCSDLTSIDLPNVTTIDSYAFFCCYNLTSVSCPNVTTISPGAFLGCYDLTRINISGSNRNYYVNSSALFENKSSDGITEINLHTFLDKNSVFCVVDENVCTIGPHAFSNADNLKYVFFMGPTHPVSEESFPCYYYSDSNPEAGYYEEPYPVSDIIFYYAADSGYTRSFDWNFPFMARIGIFDPNDLLCSVSFNADGGNGSMQDLTEIKGTVITLPECSFMKDDCRFAYWTTSADGSGVIYYPGDHLTISENMTLYACWAAKNKVTAHIQYDGYALNYSLNGLNASVSGIDNVTKSGLNIYIPENITVDGVRYNVTEIGSDAFRGCSGISSVDCPYITTISSGAFSYCCNLTSADCLNVRTINSYAFHGCSGLVSVKCPDITTIDSGAFLYCPQLTEIDISGSNPRYYTDTFALFENNTSGIVLRTFLGKNETSYAIPGNVTTVGPYAFYECSDLTFVDCSNVTRIGYEAFYHCSGLTSVNCPHVTDIGEYAFYGCSRLTSVNYPDTVTIGDGAFWNCSDFTPVIPYDGYSLRYLLIGSNAVVYNIENITESDLNVLIPENITVNGVKYNVSSVSNAFWYSGDRYSDFIHYTICGSFSDCNDVKSVFISRNVTNIGSYAFFGCRNLKDIYFMGPALPSIGSSAFSGADSNIMFYRSVEYPDFDWRDLEGRKGVFNQNDPTLPVHENSSQRITYDFMNLTFEKNLSRNNRSDTVTVFLKDADRLQGLNVSIENVSGATVRFNMTGSVMENEFSTIFSDNALAGYNASGYNNTAGERLFDIVITNATNGSVVTFNLNFSVIARGQDMTDEYMGGVNPVRVNITVPGTPFFSVIYKDGTVNADYLPESVVEEIEPGTVYHVSDYRAACDGFVFAGWTDSDGEYVAPGDNITISKDMELTASWIRLPGGFRPALRDVVLLNNIILNDGDYVQDYDLNGDGCLDIFDLVYMAQYVADNRSAGYAGYKQAEKSRKNGFARFLKPDERV